MNDRLDGAGFRAGIERGDEKNAMIVARLFPGAYQGALAFTIRR